MILWLNFCILSQNCDWIFSLIIFDPCFIWLKLETVHSLPLGLSFNRFTPVSATDTCRFYSSMGNPSRVKGFTFIYYMDQLKQALTFIYYLFLPLCHVHNYLKSGGYPWLQLLILPFIDVVKFNFLFLEYKQIIKWHLQPFIWWMKICMVWVYCVHSPGLQNSNFRFCLSSKITGLLDQLVELWRRL